MRSIQYPYLICSCEDWIIYILWKQEGRTLWMLTINPHYCSHRSTCEWVLTVWMGPNCGPQGCCGHAVTVRKRCALIHFPDVHLQLYQDFSGTLCPCQQKVKLDLKSKRKPGNRSLRISWSPLLKKLFGLQLLFRALSHGRIINAISSNLLFLLLLFL